MQACAVEGGIERRWIMLRYAGRLPQDHGASRITSRNNKNGVAIRANPARLVAAILGEPQAALTASV
jgi:hypothetical protein